VPEPSQAAAVPEAVSLAVAGKGIDPPTEADRPKLREQALQWLKADLEGWKTLLREKPDQHRISVNHRLRRWQREPDFVSLREPQFLKTLPEAEVAVWQKLWADVEAVRQQADAK